MALRAAGFKRNIFITAVAVRYAVLGLQRCLAFRAGNRHILSCWVLPGQDNCPGRLNIIRLQLPV
jgi:hypothetical protein